MSVTTSAPRSRGRAAGLRPHADPIPETHAPSRSARGRVAAAAIHALARWTPYVESEICGLRRLVRPGDVCIDIGAAGGIYTMALSWLAGPTGRVHSVEPLPFANLHVARMLNVGRATNVRQHAVALGAEPGIDVMNVPVGRFGLVTGRSFLDRRAGGPDPNREFWGQVSVMVTVDTLDALCDREELDHLDFIKIDVEGAELEVLEGGKRVIEALRPTILVEIEARHAARYNRTPDDVTRWLLDRGYSMHSWQGGWRPARSIELGTRNYLFRASSGGRPTARG
jgi:FkbM family methyltransferase